MTKVKSKNDKLKKPSVKVLSANCFKLKEVIAQQKQSHAKNVKMNSSFSSFSSFSGCPRLFKSPCRCPRSTRIAKGEVIGVFVVVVVVVVFFKTNKHTNTKTQKTVKYLGYNSTKYNG